MINVSEMPNELFYLENNSDLLYNDLVAALSLEFGKEIIDDKIRNWNEMSWDEFSSYLLNRGIDLENAPGNWKNFFSGQKNILKALAQHRVIG